MRPGRCPLPTVTDRLNFQGCQEGLPGLCDATGPTIASLAVAKESAEYVSRQGAALAWRELFPWWGKAPRLPLS